jgi:hypothetical protein
MSVLVALAGGFVGTLVLTTLLRTASEFHLTRMDLPFLLGTAFTPDRSRAKAVGYLAHFLMGQIFALGYYGLFVVLDRHDWWLGAAFGLGQGLFAGTVLVNVLLPIVHPRMGTTSTDARSVALLEPPGFMARNYGVRTPVVSLCAHVAFGTIIALFLTVAR